MFPSPYIKYSSGGKITVVGNPNLSQVKTIMIGVRNPKRHHLIVKMMVSQNVVKYG